MTTPPASPPSATSPAPASEHLPEVSWGEAWRTWARVACLSFGGPAGQIAVMHRILIEEKKWFSEERFLHALNFCLLLPGPEAQQLATYLGWLLHRTAGGFLAGLLFILPGFLSIWGLSFLYAVYQQTSWVEGVFYGLKPAVAAVVVQALVRIGSRIVNSRAQLVVAGLAFLAIFLGEVPFPVVILLAALAGWWGDRLWPGMWGSGGGHGPAASKGAPAVEVRLIEPARPTWRRSLAILLVGLTLWWAPLPLVVLTLGPDHILAKQLEFFGFTAVITFGGAYAVLTYVAQQVVENFGWLSPGEMLDGLGLAETTPGPLIMVLEFVGFVSAYRQPGPLSPLLSATLGAVLTTWATFAPCFLWIFLGAPYVEQLRRNQALAAAFRGISAAVVGVILNLTVWFALHTLFGEVETVRAGGLRWLVPVPASLDAAALVIAIAAGLALFRWKRGVLVTLAAAAVAGLVLRGPGAPGLGP